MKSNCTYFLFIFFFIRVRMSWNIGDDRNLFLKLKSKLGLYHVLLRTFTTAKTSPEKLTLTVVEKQELPDIADYFEKINFLPKRDNI